MALQYRRQKSAAGQAPYKESHRPVQHVQTASEPADENANGRSRKVDGITSSAHFVLSQTIKEGGRNNRNKKIKINFAIRRQLSTNYVVKKRTRQALLNLANKLVNEE